MTDLINDLKEAHAILQMNPAEKCPWCGVNLKLWRLEAREEHAKDAPCNWKEKECLALIEPLAWNFNREGGGSVYEPQPRETLNQIARIIKG